MHVFDSQISPRHHLRRAGTLVAALAVVAGSAAALGASSAAAAPPPSPTLTLSLPTHIGNGGDIQTASATINNTGGANIADARVDFEITPNSPTANLSTSDFVLKYESAPNVWSPIPLTADTSGGGVNGYFGPVTGFPVPTGYNQSTPLEVATNPGTPTGGITVTANLDTTPGDTTSSVANDTAAITLATPALTFASFPTSVHAGDTAIFTGTLANSTGSSYGGAAPTNSPTPAGVRLDFGIASSDTTVPASDLTLQYCLGGTDAICSGGTWTTIPLTGSNGSYAGFYGPAGGFSLPNTANSTTPFRISVDRATPTTTLTSTVKLDKVNSSGSPTGTDSSGVANGTLVTATPGPTSVTGISNPTITAALTSSAPKTSFGWYSAPVTVTFTCTNGSAPLTQPCPSPATLTANGKNRSISRTVTNTDGGSATVTVNHINIDKSAPHVSVLGAHNGHTYKARRQLRASCHDHLSGIARCTVHSHRSGHKVTYSAKAVDEAGNVATKTGSYKIKK